MSNDIEPQAGPISKTSEYRILLSESKLELVQQVIVLRNLLRALRIQLRTAKTESKPDPFLRDVLEEVFAEAKDTIRRFVDGQPVEWDI